jgi:GNAT superfamily N-acetyltransferase
MEIRSLALATDLALIATRGRVLDRGSHVVAVTPDDPDYFYGNLLALPRALAVGELAERIALFGREVGGDPAIRHVTLCWDGVDGDTGADHELTAAGFEIERMQGMTASALATVAAPRDIELRKLAPNELVRTVELDVSTQGDAHAHRRFLHRRAAWQRDLVAQGVAQFWGAFDADALVGSLGLVKLGRLGRYQDVQTAASHRRRGIAAALLSAAASAAGAMDLQQLVIMTAAGSEAARVYERLGFRVAEQTASACRKPPPINGTAAPRRS